MGVVVLLGASCLSLYGVKGGQYNVQHHLSGLRLSRLEVKMNMNELLGGYGRWRLHHSRACISRQVSIASKSGN